VNLMKSDELEKKYVVYSDENYHMSWIYSAASDKIVRFLTSPERGEQQFIALNACKLEQWIKTRIRNSDAYGTVIVFSQDMVPDIIAPDFSPSIILRTYLDVGGRVVWMGDHPFWRQGKNKKNLSSNESEWVEWKFYGMFSILGLNAEFNYSPIEKVSISSRGKLWGLRTDNKWYGTRPVQEKPCDVKVLAKSSGRRIKLPQLLKPEGKDEGREERTASSIKEILNLASLYVGLLAAILGVFSFVLVQNIVFALVPITLVLISLYLIIPKIFRYFKPVEYANAWVKNFNRAYPNSGFVRIWDCILYDISESMLEDLLNVAMYDFNT